MSWKRYDAMTMIDLESGEISIAPGLRVGPGTSERDYRKLTVDRRTETGAVEVQAPSGEGFLLHAVFEEGSLRAVLLMVDDEELGLSPEDWSLGAELARRDWHTRWLKAQGVEPPARWEWGTVDSVYDLRASAALITVIFSRTTIS